MCEFDWWILDRAEAKSQSCTKTYWRRTFANQGSGFCPRVCTVCSVHKWIFKKEGKVSKSSDVETQKEFFSGKNVNML